MAVKKVVSKTQTTKTTPAKRVIKRAKPTVTSMPMEENTSYTQSSGPSFSVKKIHIIIVALLILIGLGLYYFRGLFVVATVNGQPITRLEVIKELEKQAGKQTVNTMVTKILIMQEAKKQNISVSEAEINTEVKKVEDNLSKQGQNLDQLLAMQGGTRTSFIEDIKLRKLVEKMLAKEVAVTDAEINAYIEQNKEAMPEGSSSATLRENVKEQLTQQKLGTQFKTWLDNLQKNSKISYIVTY